MKFRIASSLFILLILAAPSLASDPLIPVTTLMQASDLTLAETPFRPAWRISVSQGTANEGSPWPEDHFVLRLYRSATAPEPDVTFEFESSYGVFELNMVDLTNDGIEDFVLISGRGRGTSARSELLRVFTLRDTQLKPVLDMVVSDYFGSGCRWWYRRDYVNKQLKGTPLAHALVLTLEHDEAAHCVPPSFAYPSLIPRAAMLEYIYDPSGDILKALDATPTSSNPPSQPTPKGGRG